MRPLTFLSVITLLLLAVAIYAFRADASEPITVLIIDTGAQITHPALNGFKINCPTAADCKDQVGHGTGITSLILNGELNAKWKSDEKVCDRVKVEVCNYEPGLADDRYFECLKRALELKPFIINYSSVGNLPSLAEYLFISQILENGTKYVVATGNEGLNLLESPKYPIMYMFPNKLAGVYKTLKPLTGITAVGAHTTEGGRWISSNTVPGMVTERGVSVRTALQHDQFGIVTGTSASAALHTHKLLLQECAK